MDFDAFCEQGIVQGEMRYRKYETEGFATPSGKCELLEWRVRGDGPGAAPGLPGAGPLAALGAGCGA